jgi:hypothetical protein
MPPPLLHLAIDDMRLQHHHPTLILWTCFLLFPAVQAIYQGIAFAQPALVRRLSAAAGCPSQPASLQDDSHAAALSAQVATSGRQYFVTVCTVCTAPPLQSLGMMAAARSAQVQEAGVGRYGGGRCSQRWDSDGVPSLRGAALVFM